MRYIIFGTGDYYERYKKWFDKKDIVALLDNSPAKQNSVIDGIEVLAPEKGIQRKYDVIVILSFYVKAMKKQLMRLGVEEENIYHFYDLHDLLDYKKKKWETIYYGIKERDIFTSQQKKRILLLTQELTLGGPPLAILHMAEVLKKNNYDVLVASMMDGPLTQKFLNLSIPVIIDERLQMATMDEINWMQGFSMIVCSTINFHIFLRQRNLEIPVIWWLHEAPFFYEGIRKENLQSIKMENLKIVAVGPIPINAFHKVLPKVSVGNLLYGVEDIGKKAKQENKKIYFTTIGFFEDIKGQDILLEAVAKLENQIKDRIKILFVGYDETLFAMQLKEKYKDLKNVDYMGRVDRKKIHAILDKTNVLICPSRQDSMPTVVAEAMMHSTPCIVSSSIGTAMYIQDGNCGFVFENQNIEELRKYISWCVDNHVKLIEMGKNARKIYEEYFSIEAFEKNLLTIVNDMYKDK